MWNVLRSQYNYPLHQCTYSAFLKNNQWTSSSSQAHFGHQESAGWPASHSIKSPSACRRCLLAICFRFSIYMLLHGNCLLVFFHLGPRSLSRASRLYYLCILSTMNTAWHRKALTNWCSYLCILNELHFW